VIEHNSSRRNFLRTTLCGAAGLSATNLTAALGATSASVQIVEPFHGAILNGRRGERTADGLKIQVAGQAPLRGRVTINGIPAQREARGFRAEVVLRHKFTDIVACCENVLGDSEHRIRVVWDKYSSPRYRFSIDDNIFFLRDIARKKYASLFDCFYLKGLKDLHEKYRAKFVLNIYYAAADDFNLTQFPDRYRSEWRDSAAWLRLAFHAYANDPDRPYQYADPAKVIADLHLVREQILRFAGEEVYSPPTVIHWDMVQPTALRPLYENGVRVLSGGFRLANGNWDVNYFLDDDRSEYLSRHTLLMDFPSGIVFSKGSLTCNKVPVEQIVPTLEAVAANPDRAEIMDLFTHEEHFWPFYHAYRPDHFQRLDAALRWVTEHGYQPVFYHEGFLGLPDWDGAA
jgi:hypothetical protein